MFDSNYGIGAFGKYHASLFQHVWSMGEAYKMNAGGANLGGLYGLAWTHTNAGGQSKAGLSHQLLIVHAGNVCSAIGTGMWTSGVSCSTNCFMAPVVCATTCVASNCIAGLWVTGTIQVTSDVFCSTGCVRTPNIQLLGNLNVENNGNICVLTGGCIKAPIVCATTGFYGSGANLTGISASSVNNAGVSCMSSTTGITTIRQCNLCDTYYSSIVFKDHCDRCAVAMRSCSGYGCLEVDYRITFPGICRGMCHDGGGGIFWCTPSAYASYIWTYNQFCIGHFGSAVVNMCSHCDIHFRKGSGGKFYFCGPSSGTGCVYICGSLSKTSGCFSIPHPDPAKNSTHNLQHSFVESPTEGDNIYRWQVQTTAGTNVITLPTYYRFLNKNDMVWVSPYRNFGSAYGEVTADQCCVVICSNQDGCYNVLLIGTRKDELAVDAWTSPEVLKPEDADEATDYTAAEKEELALQGTID
jgi:hypothetical protein